MSTQIRNLGGSETLTNGRTMPKPELLFKIEDFTDTVNGAAVIVREDGVITISEDRTVRIWLKRDSGKYWPSICQYMATPATAFAYNAETRKLFVGTDSGLISVRFGVQLRHGRPSTSLPQEYVISNDSNRLTHLKDYNAHSKRVTAVHFSLECEWVLSCGRDKTVRWHCSESGRTLGTFGLSAWATALQFDFASKYVFVGDYSGAISVLRINETGHQLVSTIKGHAGSIRCLAWDAKRQHLFSGGYDQNVVVWDIGGKQGTAYELQVHSGNVTSLYYSASTQQLFSAGEDAVVAIWDMTVKRKETPPWVESDTCQQCNQPFFWNFRMMFDTKTVGMRQHHCRHCGKAVCHACSPHKLTIPVMGFEGAVRVCTLCHNQLKDEERPSHVVVAGVMHPIVCMDLDETRKRMVTVGQDKILKIWDARALFANRTDSQ